MLSFNVIKPIRTVAALLYVCGVGVCVGDFVLVCDRRRRRGTRALLADRDLPVAIAALQQVAYVDLLVIVLVLAMRQ
jgi:hypothetical protein